MQCAQSRAGYFAQRLNNAIKGLGTKEYVKFIFLVSLFRTFLIYFNSPSENLIRILVTRCDVDLGNIKREYEKKFGRSLQADVSVMRNLFYFILKTLLLIQIFSILFRVTLRVITKKPFLLSSLN